MTTHIDDFDKNEPQLSIEKQIIIIRYSNFVGSLEIHYELIT